MDVKYSSNAKKDTYYIIIDFCWGQYVVLQTPQNVILTEATVAKVNIRFWGSEKQNIAW